MLQLHCWAIIVPGKATLGNAWTGNNARMGTGMVFIMLGHANLWWVCLDGQAVLKVAE